ncbi:MAG: hypothetical protein ACYDER_06515 [Ktedonobacteraceae bacterium]
MKNTRKHETTLSHWLHVKYLLPVFAIAALFLLAACGGSTTTTGSSSTPTATTGSSTAATTPTTAAITPTTPTTTGSSSCSLVTATQAGTILGGTVQTQSNSVTIGTTQATGCGYSSNQGSTASLAVVAATDATTAHSTFTQLQQASQGTSGSQYQTVSGLGDAAFTNGKILYVLKGNSIMIITVVTTDTTKTLPDEKLFAQAALPKVS